MARTVKMKKDYDIVSNPSAPFNNRRWLAYYKEGGENKDGVYEGVVESHAQEMVEAGAAEYLDTKGSKQK